MQITIGQYLLARLKELQIEHIFGVPGDYNLILLDQIIKYPDMMWIGTCNELNGAYACDGYARIRGAGALVTTFGVGELSAINGIAGSYAELVPIVNIVGLPPSTAVANNPLLHLNLGDGRFSVFMDMYRSITVTQTVLNKNNAAVEIDKALMDCWLKKRPVYIGVPSILVTEQIDAPNRPLNLTYPNSNPSAANECVERIAQLIIKAKSPIILADIGSARHPMKKLLEVLLDTTKIPFANMNMSKGLINESHSQYLGSYCGELSSNGVQEQVEHSDCIITFGTMLANLNSCGLLSKLHTNTSVEIHSTFTRVKQSIYQDVMFQDILPALTKRLAGYRCPVIIKKHEHPAVKATDLKLTHDYFWKKIAEALNKKSIVLAEAGTSLFGALQLPLPDDTTFISQTRWGSIGYSLGALLGANIAAPDRQTILFIGDGSFQLTAQDISTMMRHQLNPIIFLINNNGYTIERLIHGVTKSFNDIAQWDYLKFPTAFRGNVHTCRIQTESELEKVVVEIKSGQLNKDRLVLIEVMLPKLDAPDILKKIAGVIYKRNLVTYE